MVQRFAEAVLFFNPAVWLLSRRVSEFREFCCDDLVCHSAGSSQKNVRIRYAEALLQVVCLSASDRRNALGLTALAASGRSPSELRRRIARLLNEPLSEPFPAGRSLLILFGACLLWLTLPVLLPTNLSNGPSSSATLADEQVDDKATQREFRLQINGPDAKPLSNMQCEIRGISKITAADVLVGRHEKDARYGIQLVTNENGQLHFRRPANLDYLNVFVKVPGYGPYLAEWRTADGSDSIPDTFTMELESAWEEVKRDQTIRCVILTGVGEKSLCTGVDINGFLEDGDFQLSKDVGEKPDFLTLTAIQRHGWKPVATDWTTISAATPSTTPTMLVVPKIDEYWTSSSSSPRKLAAATAITRPRLVTPRLSATSPPTAISTHQTKATRAPRGTRSARMIRSPIALS